VETGIVFYEECPKIEHLRLAVVRRQSGFFNFVLFRKICDDFSAKKRNSLDVNRRHFAGEMGSNVNTLSVNPTGDAKQSVRNLSAQGSLNRKFKGSEWVEGAHNGEYIRKLRCAFRRKTRQGPALIVHGF
jgi:hypothetical protein